MAAQVNIDDFVDYEAEYKAVIQNFKQSGDSITGKCPFHDDNKNSFSVDLKSGKCHCFAGCIDGNFISFMAKLQGTDTKEAYKSILDKYGRSETHFAKEKPKHDLQGLTLTEYAFQKKLPEDFLKNTCYVDHAKGRDGVPFLKMPYFTEGGAADVFRKRYGNKEFRWSKGSSGKLCLYGLWRLPGIRQQGRVILVEGESDTQTLWYMQIPALGVPGASNFKGSMVQALEGLKVYIHVEPDQGGEVFLAKVLRELERAEFSGDVYAISCKQYGVKDPSELYIKEGADNARAKILEQLEGAKKIEFSNLNEVIPEAIKDAPVKLRQPEGWLYSEQGISHIDEKTIIPTLVCKTPIILTKRLKSLETAEERIEIAFKRDGEWQYATFSRSTVFSSRSVTALSDLGCTVTSENAKKVVQFLEALEAENIDIIEKSDSTSTLGWQGKGKFLPGHAPDVVLDIEPSLRGWAAAYHASGTMTEWVRIMTPHRRRDKFRFILASSFTAPLLRILSQRIFFVYNWGDSKGGKTSALKAALSVWGDPERLMVNFNATQVALERMAGFYNDLPMGIDERQLAGDRQDSIEKIVYMLASGTGRARGSKGGGLQQLNTWRTVCLATGEEPLSTDTSKTGVSTRVLEIYGGPFDNEKDAALMHQQTAITYGHAGQAFLDRLLQIDEAEIQALYDKMSKVVTEIAEGASGSHIAGISAVCLADVLIDSWIFKEPLRGEFGASGGSIEYSKNSWDRAIIMADSILAEQRASNVRDVNENAAQYLADWVMSNKKQFDPRCAGPCYGTFPEGGGKVYIFASFLTDVLKRAGYNPKKTLKYLADIGCVTATKNGPGGKITYNIQKKFEGKNCRFVELDLDMLLSGTDIVDDEDEDEAAGSQNGGWQPANDIPFVQNVAQIPQEELPFD